MALHLIKLCVGIENFDQLVDWQNRRGKRSADDIPTIGHVTRNRPRRANEILAGGSLYWVIKGSILARNPILRFEDVETADGKRKCRIVLVAGPVRTLPRRHRIFQGWRYFDAERAPADLTSASGDLANLPEGMADELSNLGLI